MLLFKNATILTADEDNSVYEKADLLIEHERIRAIGKNLTCNGNAIEIDCTNRIITPGLIDAHTHLGIQGEMTDQMNDHNEISSPITPTVHAIDAINPFHHAFEDARSGGVTTVQTGSGSHNIIGGVWAVIKTYGRTVEEMLLRERSGLKGALGENPKKTHGQNRGRYGYSRMAIANTIRENFEQTRQLINKGQDTIESFYQNNVSELIPFLQVLKKEMPLRLHAHRADDIATAIRLAKDYKVDLSIEHGTECYKILETVKESGYTVTLGPILGQPGKYETRDLLHEQARILYEANIKIAINTDHPVSPIEYLSLSAAHAVKYGLPKEIGLRAITIQAAEIAGVSDRVGSLEVGKDADFVIWNDHPFHSKARVLETWINGKKRYVWEEGVNDE